MSLRSISRLPGHQLDTDERLVASRQSLTRHQYGNTNSINRFGSQHSRSNLLQANHHHSIKTTLEILDEAIRLAEGVEDLFESSSSSSSSNEDIFD